ncbi:SKP1-like protein 15 [Capsella rubella]|uniref:SKP1-like protein 15 n=1 Tax=Capsella rubella TaxID=81985 RepID=UPI000CD57B62|nr:SKP1-like protein 15 [Capsella rubella]
MVIEYCKTHVDDHNDHVDASEEVKKKLKDHWDEEFMKNLNLDTIYNLINSVMISLARQLQITSKTRQLKIREVFNLKNDYTPKDRRRSDSQGAHAWAVEDV